MSWALRLGSPPLAGGFAGAVVGFDLLWPFPVTKRTSTSHENMGGYDMVWAQLTIEWFGIVRFGNGTV